MGYYTDFELNAHNAEGVVSEIEEALSEISGYLIELGVISTMKWYDYDKHMTQLSKLFPEVVFTLEGGGEETGDIWKAKYKNGKSKCVKAEIVFPEITVHDLV